MERSRFVFSGSGGQGVITAAIILGEAAVLYENLNAVQTQVYGAAARGGATRSDLIISDSEIWFPKVVQPNVLVCLTQEAYNKYSPIIRPGGLLIVDAHHVQIGRRVDAVQKELPIYQTVIDKIGEPIVFNVCMLGAVTALTGVVQPVSIMKALKARVRKDLLGVNRQALDLGLELGGKAA
ncbi:MAG: 2-oxoacid:acceptor oxidoreductase family protein [Desulfomonile tiedjei]|uniref:2-oxoacid:acceptor oxidoreductase family protein n=1 Tax=Desulfomonile tiedjei TaxID=2358 RepID=A0A9D6V1S4_9BACT|nr:2-oxoacid:acceptor oxidoreductase family protein [Desulfomonile tiedjei]